MQELAYFKQANEKLMLLLSSNARVTQPTNPSPNGASAFKYTVTIDYTVKIIDSMKGFYRAKGQDGSFILSTHFEPNKAKLAFPCFDRPDYKFRFNVTITAPADATVLSNTQVALTRNGESGLKVTEFATTPLMSTYLVAWAVGHLNFISSETKRGLKVSVYTHWESPEGMRWALEVATKAIDKYEELLGVEYKLNKMDLLSAPNFPIGAMENWGLMIFREAEIVASAGSSMSRKAHVASIVAHELAHQWFGNLVTVSSWEHLWLNEGFASLFQYVMIEHLFADAHTGPQSLSNEGGKLGDVGHFENMSKASLLVPSFDYDGHMHVRALSPKKLKAQGLNEMFDEIAYDKGGSVLYGLRHYLGEQKFFEFLHDYITQHEFGNVSYADFSTSLRAFSKKIWGSSGKEAEAAEKFSKSLDDYVLKEGAPALKHSVTMKEDGSEAVIILEQLRFLKNEGMAKTGSDEGWHIPVEYTVVFEDNQEATQTVICDPNPQPITLSSASLGGKKIKQVLVNENENYYSFPVYQPLQREERNYLLDPANVQALRARLSHSELWLVSREASILQLLDEFYDLIGLDFKTSSSNVQEFDETVFSDKLAALVEGDRGLGVTSVELLNQFGYLLNIQLGFLQSHMNEESPKVRGEFERVIERAVGLLKCLLASSNYNEKTGAEMEELSFEQKAYWQSVKEQVTGTLVSFRDPTTLNYYAAKFEDGSFSSAESEWVYLSALLLGDPKEIYEKFVDLLKDKRTPVEKKTQILSMLGAFDEEELAKRTVQIGLFEKDYIQDQDRARVITGLVTNSSFRQLGLDAVKRNWTYIKKLFEGTGIEIYFVMLFSFSRERTTIEELEELFGGDESVRGTLEYVIDGLKAKSAYEEFNQSYIEWIQKSPASEQGAQGR